MRRLSLRRLPHSPVADPQRGVQEAREDMTSAEATVAPIFQGKVLGIRGDVDLLSAAKLRRYLCQALAAEGRDVVEARDVVVDLSAVRFMDCAGLNALLEARAALGRSLHLRGLPWSLQRILELSGLRDAFTIDAPVTPQLDRLAGHASSRPVRPSGRDSRSHGRCPERRATVSTGGSPRSGPSVGALGPTGNNVSLPNPPGPALRQKTAVGGDACRVTNSAV